MSAESCDTFVVFPSHTKNGKLIFGKNSDRRRGEVQEIVYYPRIAHEPRSKLEVTFIEIDQVEVTNGVALSKPSWIWGAEMGANEFGVVVGNEAVFTRVHEDNEERLLGMDLVRLGLERGNTARNALQVITHMLEKYGQGGPAEEKAGGIEYHNSFLIADPSEAYVLETAGRLWAAERIVSGFRNISNCLSIGTNIDLMSEGLKEKAKELELWDGKEPFHFANVFTEEIEKLPKYRTRFASGTALLDHFSKDHSFDIYSMMKTLSDEESNICRRMTAEFPSQGSQISILSKEEQSVHWFTGIPDPKHSIFKPFIFTEDVKITHKIKSPTLLPEEDPVKMKPRFSKTVDRRHELYRLYEKCYEKIIDLEDGKQIREQQKALQRSLVERVEKNEFSKMEEMFNEAVEEEMKLYNSLL